MKKEERIISNLGMRIAKMRKKAGFTQYEFADHSGVAISSLKDIERGVAEGHINTRIAIAEALNCELSDLYTDPKDRKVEVPKSLDFSFLRTVLYRMEIVGRERLNVALAILFDDDSLASSDSFSDVHSAVQSFLTKR